MGSQRHAQLGEIRGTAAIQGLNGLNDLQGIADGIAQRPVHIRDQSADPLACPLADVHHGLGQGAAVFLGLHERPATRLDVQKNAVIVGGQLLAHDGGGDEGQRIHGSGHVAEGVEELVRGSQIGALPHDGNAHLIDDGLELGGGQIGTEALDGLQLVHGTAGMTQPAPAHLGHLDPQSGHDGGHRQTGLVPHAAGGVLVHPQTLNAFKVEGVSRVTDGHGEGGGLSGGHAPKIDRHAKGGGLVVGDLPRHVARDELPYLGVGQGLTVPLFLDHVVWAHGGSFLLQILLGKRKGQ